MKKILFLFLFLCPALASAQDVIVKKDGSTIISKVLEITSTEVKYKKFSNQTGPTYSISKSDVQAINYDNGEKEDFSRSTIATQDKPSYVQEDPYMLRKKFEAEDLYKEARTLNIWSWVCVVVGAGGGITGLVLCEDETLKYITLGAGIAVCCGAGGGLAGLASKKKREAKSLLSSTTLLDYNLKIGDYTLSPSVNLLTDNQTHTPHLGVGLMFNF
jgi:hypothetical protein